MVECTSKEIRAIKMVETLSLVNNTDEPRGHYIASTWTLFLCDLILIWNLKSWPHGSWEDDDAYQRPKAGRRVRSRESLVRDTMSASGGKMPCLPPGDWWTVHNHVHFNPTTGEDSGLRWRICYLSQLDTNQNIFTPWIYTVTWGSKI